MPDRQYSAATAYRYGFNGKEKDKDMNSLLSGLMLLVLTEVLPVLFHPLSLHLLMLILAQIRSRPL